VPAPLFLLPDAEPVSSNIFTDIFVVDPSGFFLQCEIMQQRNNTANLIKPFYTKYMLLFNIKQFAAMTALSGA
jgi:hypothetical protein